MTDTLDDLISENQIEPQLAMKIIANFDKAFTEIISEKVKSRLSFKVNLPTSQARRKTSSLHIFFGH